MAGARYGGGMTPADHRTAPVLETPRLVLRAHRRDDFAACAAMWADPDVVRHIGGRPFSAEESWARLLRYGGLWPLLGYGYWAAVDRASGEYVGELGFADFQRAIDPPLGAPEIGWAFVARAHGRGIATEAVRAIVAWADRALAAERTACIISPANAASLRVAAKAGYREVRRTTYKAAPTIVSERARLSPSA